MGGLLYKDFIGIGGKKLVWIMIAVTVLFLIVRLLLPGADAPEVDGVYQEVLTGTDAEMGVVYDSLLMMFPLLLIFVSAMMINSFTSKIMTNDQKNRIMHNIKAYPLAKNAYIASKYLFILIAAYALISLNIIWMCLYSGMAGDNQAMRFVEMVESFVMTIILLSVLISAIELPFFITLGVKKAGLVKTLIMAAFLFAAVAFLLFGNIAVFDHFDFGVVLDWVDRNRFWIVLVQTISPIVELGFVYLSYRITCFINRNREVEVDE